MSLFPTTVARFLGECVALPGVPVSSSLGPGGRAESSPHWNHRSSTGFLWRRKGELGQQKKGGPGKGRRGKGGTIAFILAV